jgi:hypothetical protein
MPAWYAAPLEMNGLIQGQGYNKPSWLQCRVSPDKRPLPLSLPFTTTTNTTTTNNNNILLTANGQSPGGGSHFTYYICTDHEG